MVNSSMAGLENLSSLLNETSSNSEANQIYMIDINLIDEDTHQPRHEFDEDKLQELSKSIKERGVKSPISLHKVGERFVVNHGARRLRAAKLAKLTQIPAFIDDDYTFVDQIVENIQRDDLSPKEIAEAIQKLLKQGYKKQEIAKLLGKSNAFISQHVALLNLSLPIQKLVDSGQLSDLTVINDLNSLYEKNPDAVTEFIENEGEITRNGLREFKEYIKENGKLIKDDSEPITESEEDYKKDKKSNEDTEETGKIVGKMKKAIVIVEYMNEKARLVLNKRGLSTNDVWIKFEDSGKMECIPCENITKIVSIIEG